MASTIVNEGGEITLSQHTEAQWKRREEELIAWTARVKQRKHPKQTKLLGHFHVDAELFDALSLLLAKQVLTEYSCAGVSPLDEPEDHSLYAYITLIASARTERFVQLAMKRMNHRLLVTFEPGRNRYDLSSFYIGHNRSFCQLIQQCAELFEFVENE
ncbi:hypothetical protein SAMN04487897_101251 [Paenibacillus sp. yr247]|uniref:hypothetical protein n=1 Tax=Paenibacillus sp. yr247 TaxID=1761880 RepID=UPI000882DC86|nr:hypothetical protein [Paenibacillus sp. yr247]SDM85085.1 hypothetical protein SAMN04487897_101251 [Paenibacillus sp. yr247]